MKGKTMNDKHTRRVRAGTTPPDDLPVQFAPGHEDDDQAQAFELLAEMLVIVVVAIVVVAIAVTVWMAAP